MFFKESVGHPSLSINAFFFFFLQDGDESGKEAREVNDDKLDVCFLVW